MSSHDQLYVDIAVDVLQTQNKILVEALKNFFLALPSPKCVEEVLAAAVYQLAETDPEACRWILRHSYYLEPELYIVEFAIQFALEKLQNQGFVVGEDLKVELDGHLYLSDRAQAELMVGNSAATNLILEEILPTRLGS
ncbi:MAG: hypothetical protein ACM37W_16465 [Actinomycetota bacterium]